MNVSPKNILENYSHAESLFINIKRVLGMVAGGQSAEAITEGLQASSTGKGATDEFLFLQAFALARITMENEQDPEKKLPKSEISKRLNRFLAAFNSLSVEKKIDAIIYIGFRDSAEKTQASKPESTDKSKDGDKKKDEKPKVVEGIRKNYEGCEIIISLSGMTQKQIVDFLEKIPTKSDKQKLFLDRIEKQVAPFVKSLNKFLKGHALSTEQRLERAKSKTGRDISVQDEKSRTLFGKLFRW